MDLSPGKRTDVGENVRENENVKREETYGSPSPRIVAAADEDFGRAGKAAGGENGMRELLRYAPAAAYFAASAVMSSVAFYFGTYPFGFALLCAAKGTEFVIASLAGVVLGSLFANGGAFITGIALAVTAARCAVSAIELRSGRGKRARREKAAAKPARKTVKTEKAAPKAASLPLFDESPAVRCALCAGAAAVCSAAAVIFHANVYRAAAATVMSAAVSPLLCVGYRGVFLRGKSRAAFGGFLAAAAFSLAWALSGIGVFGFSPGALFVLVCTLWGAWCLPLPDAVTFALAVSLAMPLSYVPAVLLACAAFSILKRFSAALAAGAAGVSAIALAIASGGLSSLSVCGAEFIAASSLSVPLAKLGIFDRALARLTGETPAREDEEDGVLPDELAEQVADAQKGVASLGRCFTSLGQLARSVARALSAPSETEARERVSRAFDRACLTCREQSRCWGTDYGTLADYQRSLAAALRSGEDLRRAAVPGEILSRCARLPVILRTIAPEKAAEGELGGGGKCRVFADDFTAVGEMLGEMSDKLGLGLRPDPSASREVKNALAMIGVPCRSVRVCGERMKYTELRGVEPSLMQAGPDEIRRCAGAALGVRMTEPQTALEGDTLRMVMRAEDRFRVSVGRASSSCSPDACGDSTAAFAGDDGFFRCILSDGMGSGTEAAFTAGTVTLFLERLLSAGVRLSAALSLVNRFLRERRIECSATVDLMELDLISGDARFVKSGAAPSFVLRGGRLFKLRSRTVPIGILPSADAEAITFRLEAGDTVVMTSDGVTGTKEDCPWLYDVLTSGTPGDLTASARRIADEAARRGNDDVSVIVMRVTE